MITACSDSFIIFLVMKVQPFYSAIRLFTANWWIRAFEYRIFIFLCFIITDPTNFTILFRVMEGIVCVREKQSSISSNQEWLPPLHFVIVNILMKLISENKFTIHYSQQQIKFWIWKKFDVLKLQKSCQRLSTMKNRHKLVSFWRYEWYTNRDSTKINAILHW